MAVQLKAKQTIRGEVEQVNEKGVRIAGAWWNFSKYHAVPQPYRDELVELTVSEGSNWIEALVVIEDSKGVAVRHQPAPTPIAQEAPSEPQRAVAPSGSRERTITRLAVLKAAATFAASRPDAKSTDVPRVAETWLAWVLADESEAPE